MNRTLVETVCSMLSDAKLQKQFWGEGLSIAVYLRNRSPARALGGKTPYQFWHGEKPDVKHLRVFGCVAHTHVPQDDRKKLDAKSKQCIFLGYGTDVKGYRLYDIQRSRVIFSRDVIFDEKHFGFEENEKNEVEKEQEDSRKVEIECEFRDQEVPVDQDTDNEVEVPEEANEEEEPRTRRSTRERRRPDYYGVWINNVECQQDPLTLQEAMIDPDKDKWSTAMQEISSLEDNQVWDLVELPKGKKVIGSKWVCKRKIDENGCVSRYKAHLVAQGFSQKSGRDYDETFSPIVSF